MLFYERNKVDSSKSGKIDNLLKYIWVASKLCAERPAHLEGKEPTESFIDDISSIFGGDLFP